MNFEADKNVSIACQEETNMRSSLGQTGWSLNYVLTLQLTNLTHMMNLPETGFVTLVVNVPIKSELMGGGACPTRDSHNG